MFPFMNYAPILFVSAKTNQRMNKILDTDFDGINDDEDSNEMKGMKEAVIAKHIDLDKYEHRFGSNYNNDKRLFNKHTISLPMIKRLCNALDMKATLVIEDANSDVPNPIGKKITIDVISNDEEGES